MKKVLKNNAKTKEYLDKCPKIYMVGFWADYGVREYAFAGKCSESGIPFVWDYDDHNGTCDSWWLRPLYHVTTGLILAWTTDKRYANEIAEVLRFRDKARKIKKELEEREKARKQNATKIDNQDTE